MEINRFRYIINIFPKSPIQAGEGSEDGDYPFYTSSQELTLKHNVALYNSDAIIMGTGGEASVNYVNGKFSTSTDCWVFNSEKITTKYLFYWLYCRKKYIYDLYFWGMGLKHLQKEMIKNEKIMIPDEESQKEIVEYLDNKVESIDRLIYTTKKEIIDLRKFKMSIIEENLKKDNEQTKLKYNCLVRNEKNNDESLDYFALENIESNSGNYIETSSEYSSIGATLCYPNDICFGKLRPYLNKYLYIKNNCCCSTEIAVFKEKYPTKYLLYLVQSPYFIQLCNAYSEGTKMPRINIERIKNWKFHFPCKEKQIEIVKHIENSIGDIEKLIRIKKEKITELEKLKISIIYEKMPE